VDFASRLRSSPPTSKSNQTHQILTLNTVKTLKFITMLFLYLLVGFLPLAAIANPALAAVPIEKRTLNGHCSGTATSYYKSDGICITTATCDSYGGSYITGGCPSDPDNVKCCLVGLEGSVGTNPCGGSSYCDWTANGCPGGSFHPGSCPGGSNYQCCK